MLFGLRRISMVCFLVLLFSLLFVSQVSAQETGTLIVYEEAQGGDASFSFSGSGSWVISRYQPKATAEPKFAICQLELTL